MAVAEVAESIAANGYFRNDPLLVEERPDGLVVIEGNRRLVAVKALLAHPEQRKSWGLSGIPDPTPEALATIATLPVLKGTRADLWPYIGYKHVHGAQPWRSLSKAEYIDHLHARQGLPLDEIARRIGDKRSTVERIYRGYRVLLEAERMGVFSRSDCNAPRGFSFSHLYTAVHRAGFQRYLGLRREDLVHPVPDDRRDELRQVMLWLYGSNERAIAPALRTQSPDLNDLDDVLQSDRAAAVLVRYTADERPDLRRALAEAHERTIGEYDAFMGALDAALDALGEAHAKLDAGYEGQDPPLRLAEEVVKTGRSLVERMKQARDASDIDEATEVEGDGAEA